MFKNFKILLLKYWFIPIIVITILYFRPIQELLASLCLVICYGISFAIKNIWEVLGLICAASFIFGLAFSILDIKDQLKEIKDLLQNKK